MLIKRNIPNMVTLMNLLAGVFAILFILRGDWIMGSLFIGIALVLDFLDGTLARLLHAQSPLGAQLDSLADVVSFGVAPGFMLWSMMNAPECQKMALCSGIAPYFAFLVPVFAAIRLAKFNIDTTQQHTFSGLPAPANAIFIGSLPLTLLEKSMAGAIAPVLNHQLGLLIISIVFSFLMVAPVRMLSLKFKEFTWKSNWQRYLILIVAVILIIFFHLGAFPLIILFYILLSISFIPQRD